MFSPYQISCICMRPWKKCVNKRVCKKLNDYVWYDIYPPYTLGISELGYEYDFLNNRRVADKCPLDGLHISKNKTSSDKGIRSNSVLPLVERSSKEFRETAKNKQCSTTTISYLMKHTITNQ